ncbi:rab effector Noc2 isoform X2 [Vicugna pacos]|uniref:Rab effector Noc2 isoform X2 n=1 Tax=Vicugna pacos TaxID=30538 RepID=A0ABM5BFJ8_VICPA
MADTIFGSGSNQWVCPNDRQLALRAKLQTGWSVHTYQTEKQRKSQCLSPAEVEAILQVIQRAERLDVLEQQRIGRLVERLETMRRNVMGNGLSQCLLCGEALGFLASSSVFCKDCRKTQPSAPRSLRGGHKSRRLLEHQPFHLSCLQIGPAMSFLLCDLIQMLKTCVCASLRRWIFHSATDVSQIPGKSHLIRLPQGLSLAAWLEMTWLPRPGMEDWTRHHAASWNICLAQESNEQNVSIKTHLFLAALVPAPWPFLPQGSFFLAALCSSQPIPSLVLPLTFSSRSPGQRQLRSC